MKKWQYLITGCAGFIGSNLIKNLYKNYELILVDDLSEGSIKNIPASLRKKLIKKKIQNLNKLNIKKIKGIFHLAAQASVPLSIKDFYNSSVNNLASTIRVFELSKKYSVPVVYASSSAIYGDLPYGSDKLNKFSILSPYAQDKLAIEEYAKMSFNVFKIPSIGLRLFNVYGPGQKATGPYSSVIPIFIDRMLKKKTILINGGFQTRDFVYVKDVVDIIKKCMSKVQKNKVCKSFNLGTGKSIKINTLFNYIKKITKSNPKIIRRRLEKFDPKKSSGNFNRLNKFFNLKKNNFINLQEGLLETINYFKRKN